MRIAFLAVAFCFSSMSLAQEPARFPAQDPARGAGLEPMPSLTGGGPSDFDPTQPIKPGFQISVSTASAAQPEQELSGVFTVDAAGNILLKLVNTVQVRDLTPAQAADKIAAMLTPYIRGPKVVVAIVAVPKPVVFISGSAPRTGAMPVNEDTTLGDLIAVTGFTENTDLSRIRVIRRDGKGRRTVTEYNLLRWLHPAAGDRPDETQSPALADRDMVYLPFKTLPSSGSVSVEGDVTRPGLVPIRTGLSVLLREALAMSGGLNPSADRRQVSVRRVGQPLPFVLEFDKVESGDPAHNIAVQADDVVYVQKLGPADYIAMNGAFMKAGRLPYSGPMTLTQAIAEAGGIAPSAKEEEGYIYRHAGGPDPTRTQIIGFNIKKIRKSQEPDLMLESGDTVELVVSPARTKMDTLSTTQSVLNIVITLDYLISGGRGLRY